MLRVGIMLNSHASTAWVAKVIEDIQSSGYSRTELVVLYNDPAQMKSSFKRRLHNWKFAFFHLYERWDYKRYKSNHDAMAPTDVSSLLSGIPSISIEPDREVASMISENQLREIRGYDLDVIFHLDSSPLPKNIFGASRYGIWSFQHGDEHQDHPDAPLFRELVEGNPVSGSRLMMFTESATDGRIVDQSYASTDRVSLYVSGNPVYWKTAEFALRGLRDLHAGGMKFIQSLPTSNERESDTRRRDWSPNNLQMIFFARQYLSRWLQARRTQPLLKCGAITKWYVAIRRRRAAYSFDDSSNYLLMPCPADRFYADPFLFEREGKTYLFFEDFRYEEGRAVISVCEIRSDSTPGLTFEVLRCPFHLSYPFVFEHEGDVYMIPETRGNLKVELFRATTFPTGWISEAVLLNDVHVVDATIHIANGKFWMFAGVSNGNYSNSDELCLFFADALTGPWTPHAANPVLSDVRRSRPAGRVFYDEGRLIRPSQDCGKAYGYALVFSEVLTLSETEYEERQISRLEPDVVTGCIGTHTYNRTEQFEVVDRTLTGR
jgi:hypothetical protein